MPTRSLNVLIAGDAKPLGVAAGQANRHIGSVESSAKRMGQALKVGFALGGAAAVGGLVIGLKKSADAAKDAEISQAKMVAQLKASGIAYAAHAKQIDDVIQKTSKLAGLDDEDLQDAFTNIVRVTKDVDKGLRLTGLAADFARAKHMDVAKAGELVGKVAGGNTGILSRYGLAIKPVTDATDALAKSNTNATTEQRRAATQADKNATAQKAIAALQKTFGGQAEAYGKTAAGAQERFGVALENVQEKIGAKLLPVLGDGFNAASKFLDEIDKGTGIGGKFADAISGIGGAIGDAVGGISGFWKDVAEESKGGGASIGSAIISGIGDIDWRGLGETVSKGFNAALKIGGKVGSAIVDAFQQVPWDTVGDTIGKGIESSLNFADTLPPKISSGISQAVAQVNGRQVLGKLVDVLGEAIDALFSPSFWIDHFKGIFATVTLVIPVAKILKIPGAATLFKFISKPVFDAIGFLGKGMLTLFGKAASSAATSFLEQLERVLPRTASVLLSLVTGSGRALSRLPGRLAAIAGDAATAVAQKLGSMTGTIVGKMTGWIVSGVKGLARYTGRVAQEGTAIGRSILSGIVAGLGTLGHAILDKVKDAIGWVGDQVTGLGKSIGKKLGIGDGVGVPQLPSGGGSGSLMGADNDLMPFASLAGSYGLHPSSGIRPGSITSSGNVSYHSSGDAIDEVGPMPAMRKFASTMFRKYGSRLRELISPWPELGIKDGKPFRYSAGIQADHSGGNAHVHFAYTGPFGDGGGARGPHGDGLGSFRATSYGPPWGGIQGTGTTATGVDLHSGPHRYGVAVDPSVIPLGTDLKISPNPFNYSGAFEAFDTGGAIKGNRIDFYDWRGRKAQLGWGMRTVKVSTVDGSSVKRGSKGKPKTGSVTVKATGKTDILPSYTDAEAPSASAQLGSDLDDQAAAKAFVQKRAGKAPARPVKGRTAEEAGLIPQAEDAEPGPTIEDYANQRVAEASLTAGTDDDLSALNNLFQVKQGQLEVARATGDPRKIIDAINGLKSVEDSIKSLQASNDSLAQALAGVQAELKAQTDFAKSVTATSSYQATKTIADLISGHIVGRGIAGRAFTPGSGTSYAY